MPRIAIRSLRVRLALLVLLAVLPAIGLTLYTAYQDRAKAAEEAEATALRLARVAAQDQLLLIEGAHQFLLALSQLPEALGSDPAACNDRLAGLLVEFPRYANIGVIAPNGNLYCSALPFTPPMHLSDRTYFQRALASKGFSVGEYQIGRVTGRPGINFGYAVTEGSGTVKAVVFVALDLDWVNQLGATADLPEGSTLTVFDRKATILARYPDPKSWVGRLMPEADLVEAVLARGGTGSMHATGIDGVDRLYGFTSLPVESGSDGVFVTVGIPSSVAFADVGRILLTNLVGLALVGVLALGAAWFGGEALVLRRVDALVRASRRLGQGDMSARVGMAEGDGELEHLGRAFDDMAAKLAEREASLKRSVEELRKANRRFRMLSTCNQVLVRTVSAEKLLKDICWSIVETGGYRLAWIGLAEESEDKPVRPAAYAGFEDGYLESIRISWGDNEYGRGPTGTAIRTGRPSVARDVLKDDRFAPWREEAIRRGYASSIALPLMVEGRVLAALNVYASEPDAFAEDEISLLEELASDVTYGLVALRQNAERVHAEEELRRRAMQQEALNTIIGASSMVTDLPELLDVVMDRALQALSVTRGALWLDEYEATRGIAPDVCRKISDVLHEREDAKAEAIVVEDWKKAQRDGESDLAGTMVDQGVRASVVVAVSVEGKRVGGICFGATEPRAWTAQEVELIRAIGSQLGGTTDRLRLIEMTQLQARQLQRILDTVQEGILALDEGSNVILANPKGKEYLSLLAGTGVGERLTRLGGKPLADAVEVSKEGLPAEIILDGPPERVFDVSASPSGTKGSPGGATLLIREVTGSRQVQKRVELQDRLAALGQLAAGIAHDFNNIMGTIILYSEMLRQETQLSEKGRERLETVFSQAGRAADLTQQILDFSRRAVVSRHPMALVPFVKEFQKLLERTLPENIDMKFLPGNEEYIINADPGRMQQVFMNLSLNARDAMAQGGTIQVDISRLEVKKGERPPFRDMPAREWVCIRFSDTGPGIPTHVLPHIFEPFFTTKVPGEGTGLGLSQVYGIVKQHDGYIDVDTRVGAGTMFMIYLPAVSGAAVPGLSIEESAPARGEGETVLVVEDDPGTQRALREALENLNYRVIVASDGHEATERIEAERATVALILSDMVMPKMSGIELYKWVREKHPGMKMILVTGYPLGDSTRQLLEEGRAVWLQKPFDSATLGSKVADLLRGQAGVGHPGKVP